MNRKLILSLLIAVVLYTACKKSSDDGGNNPPNNPPNCSISFASRVSAIVQTNCAFTAGCHGAGSTNSGGPLTNHSQIFNRRSNIRAAVQAGTMPQGATLSAADKADLISWIDCGAPNN
ncbi:cytochrome c [Lacibacter sp. MH-610]|uniref:c-type cytochrome n=1 Tax=Lacibacter sp. MH-610 TaxID=3020883 RepID=UPI003891D088